MKTVICITFLTIQLAFSVGAQPLFPAKQNGAFGYIDKTGAWVVKPSLDNAYPFVGGLARVARGGKWASLMKRVR